MVFLPNYCLDYKCLTVTYTVGYYICKKSYSADPRLDFFKSDAHVGWLSPSFDAHNKLVCLSLSVSPSLIFMRQASEWSTKSVHTSVGYDHACKL